MVIVEKTEHRFGFTTRGLDTFKQQRAVLESSSGKLVLGMSNCGNASGPVTDLKDSLDDRSASKNITDGKEHPNIMVTGQSNARNSKYVWDKKSNALPIDDAAGSDYKIVQADSKTVQAVNTRIFPLIREKSVSIPRTKLIDDIQSIAMRSVQFHKSSETGLVNGRDSSTLHTSDLITTAYQVCDDDKDAMEVSIESPKEPYAKPLPKTTRFKRKPHRQRWTQSPSRVYSDDVTCINVSGVSDFTSGCNKDKLPDSPCSADKLNCVKQLPHMDHKQFNRASERRDSHSQITRHSLLRKSWRLAISRGSPVSVDRSDVFVSGVNIHPVHNATGDTGDVSPQTTERNITGQEKIKPTELLKLSFPVFQNRSNRRSPILVWDEHKTMEALGRPKSVNERSLPETIKRSKTLNRIELRKGPLESISTSLSLPFEVSGSDEQILEQPSIESKQAPLGNNISAITHNRKIPLQPILDKDSRILSYRRLSPSPVSNSVNSAGISLQCSPKTLVEPIMRLSNTSSKMQGPSSNVLDFNSNFKPDLSVQKEEKGARFRVCKPMFDSEDYEDFQHKKYKKNMKFKRPRNKAEGVNFLRVKIGEL